MNPTQYNRANEVKPRGTKFESCSRKLVFLNSRKLIAIIKWLSSMGKLNRPRYPRCSPPVWRGAPLQSKANESEDERPHNAVHSVWPRLNLFRPNEQKIRSPFVISEFYTSTGHKWECGDRVDGTVVIPPPANDKRCVSSLLFPVAVTGSIDHLLS